MLNKKERDALRIRLGEMTADTNDAPGSTRADSPLKEWVSALLTHADAADGEIARLTAELDREKAFRERAEKGMDFYESGEWVI